MFKAQSSKKKSIFAAESPRFPPTEGVGVALIINTNRL